MPEVTQSLFNLDGKSPAEWEERRREVIKTIASFPKSFDDPDCPIELLQELALLAGMLRRKNSGPAASPKRASSAPKADAADLLKQVL